MPDIREFGTSPDGNKIRAYEVDFDTEKESWSEYNLSDGTRLRIKHTLLKVFRVVDDTDQPLIDENGDPVVFVNGAVVVVTSQRKEE